MARDDQLSRPRGFYMPFRLTSNGFTLIEVLIALLVLAIGLVGLASLHLAGMRNAHSSYYTSIASSVALDLEERLWLGMSEISSGCLPETEVTTIASALETQWGTGTAGTITLPSLTIATDYDSDKVNTASAHDYWVEVKITVTWDEGRFGGSDEVFPYTARVICAREAPPST